MPVSRQLQAKCLRNSFVGVDLELGAARRHIDQGARHQRTALAGVEPGALAFFLAVLAPHRESHDQHPACDIDGPIADSASLASIGISTNLAKLLRDNEEFERLFTSFFGNKGPVSAAPLHEKSWLIYRE